MLTDPNEMTVTDLIRKLAEGHLYELEVDGLGKVTGAITFAFAEGDVLEVSGVDKYICVSEIINIKEIR